MIANASTFLSRGHVLLPMQFLPPVQNSAARQHDQCHRTNLENLGSLLNRVDAGPATDSMRADCCASVEFQWHHYEHWAHGFTHVVLSARLGPYSF